MNVKGEKGVTHQVYTKVRSPDEGRCGFPIHTGHQNYNGGCWEQQSRKNSSDVLWAKVIFFITTWGHDPWAEIAAPKQLLIIFKDPQIPYLPIAENF